MTRLRRGAGLLVLTMLIGGSACRKPVPQKPPAEMLPNTPMPVADARSSATESLPPTRESHVPSADPIASAKDEPTPETDSEPLNVGCEVMRPERVSGAIPNLRDSRCESTGPRGRIRRQFITIIKTVIDRDGRVTEIEFLKHKPDSCIEDYLTAELSTWRFKPATLRGEPVSVNYYLTLRNHFR